MYTINENGQIIKDEQIITIDENNPLYQDYLIGLNREGSVNDQAAAINQMKKELYAIKKALINLGAPNFGARPPIEIPLGKEITSEGIVTINTPLDPREGEEIADPIKTVGDEETVG